MRSHFDKMKFFDYKGSDMLKRQIFFLHLKLIDFYDLDNEHLTDNLILYLSDCKVLFIYPLDIKQTLSALKQDSSRLTFIVFCKDALRKNFPSVYFAKTVSKIVSSLNLNEKIKIEDIEVVFFQAGFVLKLFIYFLRIYIEACIWNRLEFIENYDSLNEKYFFEIHEETQYETLRIKFKDEIESLNISENTKDKTNINLNMNIKIT